MKTFFLVVVLSIGSGLAVRFYRHRHDTKPAEPVAVTQPVPAPTPPEPPPVAPTPTPTPTPTPAPEPPRIAGSTQITDATVQHFAVGPGVIYYCDGHNVVAQPKSGDSATVVGECEGAFDFVADAQAVFYCDQHHLKRITVGTQGDHAVADLDDCIMEALDAKYAYFVVPGFEGVENPGVYRVARTGGTPERIHATRPKEQFMLAVDDDGLWIGAWAAGSISKLAKTPGAAARAVVTGQKGIVSFATDSTYLYWYAENTTEVRRRKKTGGAVEVIGHDVDQEPVRAADGHVYWFEGKADADKRLVHLAPGAKTPDTIASGLRTPSLAVDAEGEYVTELDRPGVFMFKR